MKLTTVAGFLASAAVASAGSATSPLLAFTSTQANSLGFTLPSTSSLSTFMDSLFSNDQGTSACTLDAVVLVSVDHLDKATFAGLKHTTNSLRTRALDAPSQLTFAVSQHTPTADRILRSIENSCHSKKTVVHHVNVGDDLAEQGHSADELSYVNVQVNDLRKEESLLLKTLSELDDLYPRNLVVVTESNPATRSGSGLYKRQYKQPLASNGNWTEPTGGIFARYQLFSTPLILTLLLVGGLLFPIVFFAVSQLAQIQAPDQMGVRKDPITGDKKTQ